MIELAIRMAYDPDMEPNEFIRQMDALTYGWRSSDSNGSLKGQ